MHKTYTTTGTAILAALLIALLTGCATKLSYDGKQTTMGQAEKVKHCRLLGNTQISVNENLIKVLGDERLADMLQIEARNFAGRIGADTIVPIGKPEDGRQLYKLYNCNIKKRQEL